MFTLPAVHAQSSKILERGEIESVRLEGLNFIEKGIVLSVIESQAGTVISPQKVADDINTIFKLGYFSDVKTEVFRDSQNRLVLTFAVKEKPRVKEIDIQGNTEFDIRTLQDKMSIKENNMLNYNQIEENARIILKEYDDKGFSKTRVTYEVREINPKAVSLIYKIEESPRIFLTDIDIKIKGYKGKTFFYPLDIKRILASAEIDCFSWFTQSGVFLEEKVKQDLMIIKQTYMMNGFIKVKVDKPEIEMIVNKDYSRIKIKLNIDEGPQYFSGKIDFSSGDGNKLLFKKENMLKKLKLQKGDPYSPFKKNQDQYAINDIYQEQGYAFSFARSSIKINEAKKIVDVNFRVYRGEKAYIRRVEFSGNRETRDYVILRELKFHDSELFNGTRVRESQSRLARLGYFTPGKGIHMKKSRVKGIDNELDYDIELQETQTGTFTASVAYSEYGGTSLILNVTKRNFMGRGQSVSLSGEWSDKGKNRIDFKFTEPYLFDTMFTGTLGLYYLYNKDDDFNTLTRGINYTVSYPFWPDWRGSLRYSYKTEKYSGVTEKGEDLLDDDLDGTTFQSLRPGISYNTVNNPMLPSDGFEASFYAEQVGGFIGDGEEYQKFDFFAQYFKSINEAKTVVLMAKLTLSELVQNNPDKEIPYSSRFSIGGITTVHGHDWGDIKGPTSSSELPKQFDYDALSEDDKEYYDTHRKGTSKRVLNLEALFPLTREGQNMRGVVFYDAGNVWSEDRMYEITGTEKLDWYYRQSIGTGIRLITPVGVLRFEYGYKLDKRDGESPGKFDFHISGLF